MKIAVIGTSRNAGSRITAELASQGRAVTAIARNPGRNARPMASANLIVGGAGSLEMAPGVRLGTTPGFPAQNRAEAEKGAAFLDLPRAKKELNWTFRSPSGLFTAGGRTESSVAAPTSF